MTRKYETLLLFSPDLNSEERQAALNDLENTIASYSGKILAVDDWGMKNLAYPVQTYTRGVYIRLEFLASGKTIQELERRIRLNDGIMKFLTVKLEEKSELIEEA